ncbi:NAD(P)H-dependent oxidoreductase [Clostridium oryzae]|uniref:NADPH-dependent FMN reductase n=1 Tax=Clostridium oryzae TaxID=1450648 RepID=A0A1V4ISW9_9CLOT|nr:NAD(P)H-dependent oxidoreductase [Clostridium oryzae]OPJ62895.1 NADPH-dependent FMN reductase [Clostridium oryzae]
MVITCISASNIKHAVKNSTSLKTCKIIKDLLKMKVSDHVDVEIIPLVNYELESCIGCGSCFQKDVCVHDESFNRIYQILVKSDALFIVSAHYAPIPSKLSMLLEKIEQLAFLKRFNNENYRSPLFNKPVGIVAHGGGTEEIIKYYKEPVLDSIWNALSYPVEMNIVETDDEHSNGVILPVKSVKRIDTSIFPMQEYDWSDIKERLSPLVSNVLDAVLK